MITITYFVHGTTVDNEREISSGWNDVGLSDLGIKQSKELAALIADKTFDAVFTSDLSRAIQSAKLTWSDAYQIRTDSRLRECNYGDYSGKDSAIVEPMQEQCVTTPMPNGESYEDVKARVSDFLESIRQEYDGKNIAIVAHKAPQLALEVISNGKTWEEAFADDWRIKKAWQPGWEYKV
jgi:alpha-ribazole phosphatase/probable phosphoglycerate mutase